MSEKKPLVVALYLPQFYETEYNNKWWEKGYTEWYDYFLLGTL